MGDLDSVKWKSGIGTCLNDNPDAAYHRGQSRQAIGKALARLYEV